MQPATHETVCRKSFATGFGLAVRIGDKATPEKLLVHTRQFDLEPRKQSQQRRDRIARSGEAQ